MRSSHCCEYEICSLLECGAVQFGRTLPAFRLVNIYCPIFTLLPWRPSRQQVSLKLVNFSQLVPEDEGVRFLRNHGKFLPDITTSCSRKQWSIASCLFIGDCGVLNACLSMTCCMISFLHSVSVWKWRQHSDVLTFNDLYQCQNRSGWS